MKTKNTERHMIDRTTSVNFTETDNIFDEVATRKRSIDFHSALYYLPNPDPTLKKQGKDIQVYSDLLVDPSVSSNVASFKDGVCELEWEIDRGKSKSAEAELIKQIFDDLDTNDEEGGLNKIFSDILDARLFGYQPIEVMWEKVGGRTVPVNLISKPQEWFVFGENNKMLFRTQAMFAGEPLPDFKFLCPKYQASYLNPYGRGVLSSCFWPVTFKKGGLKFFIQFCEKYGMPYIIGEHSFTDEQSVKDFVEDLDTMVGDGIIAIAKDKQTVNVEQTGSSQSADLFVKLRDVMHDEISYAVLNHNRSTTSTQGKLGNEDGAFEVRESAINSGKKIVQQSMNVLIKWIFKLNGMSGKVPRFYFFEEDDVDMDLAKRDEILTKSGVRFKKVHYVKNYGLDEEDFDLIEPKTAQVLPPGDFAEKSEYEDQRLVDEIADFLTDPKAANEVGQTLIDPIIDFIEKSSSYEDALSHIAAEFKNVDVTKLEAILARSYAASHAIGVTHAGN